MFLKRRLFHRSLTFSQSSLLTLYLLLSKLTTDIKKTSVIVTMMTRETTTEQNNPKKLTRVPSGLMDKDKKKFRKSVLTNLC